MNPNRIEMMQMTSGYWISKSLYCAAKANVADNLSNGPQPLSVLAEKSNTEPDRLFRILRALAAVGIFKEIESQVFELTPKAEYLKSDHPESLKNTVLMLNDDLFEAWCDLDHAVSTRESAVDKRFGSDFFVNLMQNQQKAIVFDKAMQEIHLGEAQILTKLYDFSKHSTIMDVGGGNGSMMQAILESYPAVKGIVFDLPPVVERAQDLLGNAGLQDRVQIQGGSFFENMTGKADCVFMRHIIHDWDDEKSIQILKNSAQVLEAGQTLLIAEKVVPQGNDFHPVKLLDINMMVIGGKERTENQYSDLLEKSGFKLIKIHYSSEGAVDIVQAQKN